jgi:UDP-glucose 4-epimerase
MKWLVTGGAGYIGSHTVRTLLRRGHQVAIIDDFSTGREDFVPEGVQVHHGSILDEALVQAAFSSGPLNGVIHFAGFKFAGESVTDPIHTYRQNVTGMMNIIDGMVAHKVTNIIFSSSSAVYGDGGQGQFVEGQAKAPMSPYGESKLIGEWLLADAAAAFGIRSTSLRYFNVVGAREPGLFDTSPHGLFSLVFQALVAGKRPKIFGNDYATIDGTCVRDYIPVGELADVHAVAAERLARGDDLEVAYNIGTGTGHSVAEVMRVMSEVTGIDFEPEIVERRPGDPPTVVASGELARRDLEWDPNPDLRDMVRSAWVAFQESAKA